MPAVGAGFRSGAGRPAGRGAPGKARPTGRERRGVAMAGWEGKEWVWVRPHMTAVERELLVSSARRRGDSISAVARELIVQALENGGEDVVQAFVREANEAGVKYNSAVRMANYAARRYGLALKLSDDEYEGMCLTLDGVARAADEAAEAAKGLPKVPEGALIISLATRYDSERGGRPARVGVRVPRELADQIAARAHGTWGGISLFVRGAIVVGVLGETGDFDGRRLTFSTDKEIGKLILAGVRWEVNREQAEKAISSVRSAQTTSRFLAYSQAERVKRLCNGATRATEGAALAARARFEGVKLAVVDGCD